MAEVIRLGILAPRVLRQDRNGRAFLAALDGWIEQLEAELPLELMRQDVDSMPEWLLDEMAWERFVTWYDDTADLETKRGLIRDSRLVHARMGTPWAVQQVVVQYFGDGRVLEWYEYGGEPYHFSVGVENLGATQAQSERLRYVIDRVKNVRSVFDGVYVVLDVSWGGYFAACVDEGEILELREAN